MSNTPLVGKHRRGTTFSVLFPTLPSIKQQPHYIDLIQKQQKHDVAVIDYNHLNSDSAKLLKTGVPVQISWKQGVRTRTFYGYVSTVTQTKKAQGIIPAQVHVIGSSFVLKNRVNKVYKNKTIPEVAAKIAKEHGLRFIGKNHSRRFPQLTIAGHSQWEWLQEQAKRIGYGMYMEGTSLVFQPLDKLLDTKSTDVPLFQMWSKQIPKSYHMLDRTLDYIRVINGENTEFTNTHRAIKQVGGVNPLTGKTFVSNKSPSKTGKAIRKKVSATLFNEHISDQVVNSPTAAFDTATGTAHMARFNLPAKAEGQGDPRVHPYGMVYIQGIGDINDGHWVVKEVTHRFRYGGDYMVDLLIATDGTEQNSQGVTVDTTSMSPSKTNPRSNDTAIAGTVNLNQILSGMSSFDSTQSLSKLSLAGKARESNTTRLSVKTPFITNVGNQGYTRTPSRWRSTKPSDSSLGNGRC